MPAFSTLEKEDSLLAYDCSSQYPVALWERFTFLPGHFTRNGNQIVPRRAEGARFTLRVLVLDAEP
jgi:hypothetical protein